MPPPIKPPPVEPGDVVRIVATASPVEEEALRRGCAELERLGYQPRFDPRVLARQGFFAGSAEERTAKLLVALEEENSAAIVCARGGYGSGYLLDRMEPRKLRRPKALVGYSDVTSLQLYLWRKKRWVGFYGPMAAAGIEAGAGAERGYDEESFLNALTQTSHGWKIELQGQTLFSGSAEGTLLGGCLTLIEATLGTPWEIETRGTILLLEDRGMKPWQVDRALLHLRQAGKFQGVRGIVLGDFADCEAPAGTANVRDVCERLIEPLKIPAVWGAPIGHTMRPMLTIPLGVKARVLAQGNCRLEILEPACRSSAASVEKREKPRRRS